MSREKVCTEFDCQRNSVIVHQSASDKLAVVHSSCMFGAESYSGQRERKSVLQGFKYKSGAPKEDIVENHINIALLNVIYDLNDR